MITGWKPVPRRRPRRWRGGGDWSFRVRGTTLGRPLHLIRLGLIISICGQLGDLLISSIKRDLDIKDMGVLFPGHGGWLDRFDSLILVAPAVFNYIGYYRSSDFDRHLRILSG